MGAVRVVIRNVCTKNPTQVVFAENDHVVDDLPTRGADPSLREPVLPRGPGRDSQLGKAEVVDPAVERGAEDLVTASIGVVVVRPTGLVVVQVPVTPKILNPR